MTGEQTSGGAQQQPPEHCFLANARGRGSLENAKWYPFAQVCSAVGCTIIGNNLDITHGVGAETVKVSKTLGRTTAPGCPDGAFIMHNGQPEPLSRTAAREQKSDAESAPELTLPDRETVLKYTEDVDLNATLLGDVMASLAVNPDSEQIERAGRVLAARAQELHKQQLAYADLAQSNGLPNIFQSESPAQPEHPPLAVEQPPVTQDPGQ